MAKVRSHAASSIVSTVPPVEAPAAVSSTSMRPHLLITRSMPVRALALLLTSAVMVIVAPPLALISAATFSRKSGYLSPERIKRRKNNCFRGIIYNKVYSCSCFYCTDISSFTANNLPFDFISF